MGTGFSIDTPLKVARFGISSVISLVDDVLIEQMRRYYCEKLGEHFSPVTGQCKDSRARRITLYLDLLDREVQRQVRELKAQAFTPGSDIVRYFELLPDGETRRAYMKMVAENDPRIKLGMQDELRGRIVPGSIDVNIITKSDKQNFEDSRPPDPEFSDAMSALRGYALSSLRSSVVFSAGMHARLYTYLTRFEDFFPDSDGNLKKKVVLKVSDYRSAEVQGKFLARRGIWVSEYRIESGLNCGGHAFPTNGLLLGPILEQFKQRRDELVDTLFRFFSRTLASTGRKAPGQTPAVRITVQGGIGTSVENDMLMDCFGVDGTGWGTPFLLVPEVTSVDDAHLAKLMAAGRDDVYLSDSSPLGPPFWNLRNSQSEDARRERIRQGIPGSPCPKRYSMTNTEFSNNPICVASRQYQKMKLESIEKADYTLEQYEAVKADVLAKSCICHDLSGGVKVKYGIEPGAAGAMCCGPNIAYFDSLYSLSRMVDHIYGRIPSLVSPGRPHMFHGELLLYVDYLKAELKKFSLNLSSLNEEYFSEFKSNLLDGIEYYRNLTENFLSEEWLRFRAELSSIREQVENLVTEPLPAT